MGFIRGGISFVLAILLLLSLLIANSFFVVSSSLDYENVKPQLISSFKNLADEQGNLTEIVNEKYPAMQMYCAQDNTAFVFSYEELDMVFEIPCEIIQEGAEQIIDYVIEDFLEKIYYKKYDCGLFDCVSENEIPFYIISEHTKNYCKGKFYLFLVIILIFMALMLLVFENKANALMMVGALAIISSLPFMKVEAFVSPISNFEFLKFFTLFFTKAYSVFLIVFITGLVILALGIGLRFWKFKGKQEISSEDKFKPKNEKKK